MKKNVLKISIILSILVLIISLIAVFSLTPKINLQTDNVTINVFEDYNPISYNATSLGKDISDDVVIEGSVDNNHVGVYKIIYSVKNSFFKTKKQLIVNVVDNISPELNLIGGNEYKVCSLESFVDPGYSAIDNYDGDITSKVQTKYKDDYNIEYKVSDSSNNTSTSTRNIIVEDSKKPEIILNGNEKVYITKNNKYNEKGAISKDNCDGDLTNAIEIEGNVDTSKNGTYEIKYKVKDSSGNENTAIRTVIVQNSKKKETSSQDNTQSSNTSGTIYLTFDDGPGSYTNQILDILKKYDIKATFFVTLAGSDSVLKREADENHTVGLHTATHNYKQMYASVDEYFYDLNRVSQRVTNVTGIESKIIRFPGGTSNRVCKAGMSNIVSAVDEKGYTYFDWNVSVEDAGVCAYKKTADARKTCVLNNFKKYIRPNRENIVLMHDIKSYTANALESMIEYAKANGYSFKKITKDTTPVHFKPYR